MTTADPDLSEELYQPPSSMQIVSAVFSESIDLQPAPGPSTRIELSGIQFSTPASDPLPTSVTPHLVVLVWNPPTGREMSALEVRFFQQETGKLVARNVQPLQIEPGKFNYRLVRAELSFAEYGTVVAVCRIDDSAPVHVPFTLLEPPAE